MRRTSMVGARPLHPLFAAEVSGLDLARPVPAEDVAAFRRLMDEYAVAVIRHARPLDDAAHVAFSRQLGPLPVMKLPSSIGKASEARLPFPELIDVGNIDSQGHILPSDDRRRAYNRGNLLWHTDRSYDAVRAAYSLLSAHIVPAGGADTEFADMRAAYDSLPERLKRTVDDLVVEHSVWHSRRLGGMDDVSEAEKATRPPSRHGLVHRHRGSGRKVLYLASHISHVVGWPLDEGRALIDELVAHATQPRFVYRHRWRVSDLVVWDNLQTMHRGTPFDDTRAPRDMRRCTVSEIVNDAD